MKFEPRSSFGTAAQVMWKRPCSSVVASIPRAVTTLALGIPGSAGMSVLLGGFLLLGLEPGPDFLANHMDLAVGLAIVLAFANLVAVAAMLGHYWSSRVRGATDALIRLSVGIEDAEDLKADLEGAFAAMAAA